MTRISTGNIVPTKLTIAIDDNPTAASGTLTSDNTSPSADETVTIGTTEYTFVSSLTEAKGQGVVTSTANGNPADGDTLVVDDITYTFKTELTTDPDTVPNEILIGTDGNGTLTNLKAAINGEAGEGTTYSTGTVAHATVSAPQNPGNFEPDYALTLLAREIGEAGNVTFTEDADNITIDGSGTFSGGADSEAYEVLIESDADDTLQNLKDAINGTNGDGQSGVKYSSATTAHTLVTAGALNTTAHTLIITARTAAHAGNSIASTETSEHLLFGAENLEGGGSTIGTATVGNEGGLIRRLISIAPQFTGTPTYTISIITEDGDALYTTGALNENATTNTAQEMLLSPTDTVKITTNAKVEETLPIIVYLR